MEELLNDIVFRFPEIKGQFFDNEGGIRSSFSILVNGQLVKRGDYNISLKEGDELSIIQLIAGG